MFIRMDNLLIYNISQLLLKFTPKYISIIFICILLTLFFIYFNTIKSYGGYIRKIGENSFLILYTNSDLSNKKIYINNKLYEFKILKKEKDKIILKVTLDSNINFDYNVVLVNVLGKKIFKNKGEDLIYEKFNR